QQIPSTEITSNDKLWAALAYVFSPVVPIIILLLEEKKDRPYLKAHNMQALILGALGLVINIILGFMVIGVCTGPLTWILMIYFGYKAYQGEQVNIPLITDFVKKQGWA
ncbi:MAG: DUF4870 domain-containing protein, partial [Anaerolineaceae bacterium]|nr:DUF4870 domain-containing protein [Anaerolineaceae bacterium]